MRRVTDPKPWRLLHGSHAGHHVCQPDWWLGHRCIRLENAFVVGLPGLLIAAVFKLTVKEPPRGYTDPQGTQSKQPVELREAIRELMTKPAFWWMTAGATVAAFCGYGISSFQSIFLVRMHEITTGEAAIWINAPVSMSSAIGTFATGWLATKLYKKHPGAIATGATLGLALSIPFYVFALRPRI